MPELDMQSHFKRLMLLVLLVALVVALATLVPDEYLSFAYLKSNQERLSELFRSHPWQTAGVYFLFYVVSVALSLPWAAVLGLAAGAIFGLLWGAVIVSFASTLGATLAFLIARHLARDWVQRRFGKRLAAINRGVETEGGFYLFALRLVPLFPFFLINLAMGLTPMRTWTFMWVSQVGMLAGTLVYVNAGTRIGELESVSGLLSPGLLASFALLGLFPLAAKHVLAWLRRRRRLARWVKPKRFDRDLIVVGGGSAGLVAAYLGATLKAQVSLIEKQRMGGDCLNTGCVPSKALIRTARFLADVRRHRDFGVRRAEAQVDFAEVMERVRRVIRAIEPHDSVERYSALGVDCIAGEARLVSPWQVEVGGRTLSARGIILATGAAPVVPTIPGLDAVPWSTSDNLWELAELPPRLLVLGGGPLGCELAQAFARLGSGVTIVERAERLLMREDPDISALVAEGLETDGIRVLTGTRAVRFRVGEGGCLLEAEGEGGPEMVELDRVLLAVGRRATTDGLGLEALGIGLNPNGTVVTDASLRTEIPTIHACGDVAGPFQFTHAASHQAWYAAVNALFGGLRRFRVDYSALPMATYTDPEVGRVGLSETEASERGIGFEVTRYDLADLDRAIADSRAEGLVKVLTKPGTDRLLGAAVVGHNAAELIGEFVTAMRSGHGLNRILGTIHPYPTWGEANRYVAGAWKRAHAPQPILGLLARYHGWRRNGGRLI
jgi:pyruvate/2-oxoglutarate dehydrogenase complex dihydrolipoamide dehydrogenase (E3) component/uncharacterized membrane protein YdjX (TVP38/TMEM64 family)